MSLVRTRTYTLILLALASLSPFVALFLYPDGYPYDIYTFLEWKECLKAYSTQPIFPCTPKTINYPTVGLYASSGVLWALEAAGSAPVNIASHFRLVLTVFDILNVIVMYLILRGLQIRHAALATLFFAYLPSTRAGASLWGQVDTVSQLFLSLSFLFGLRGLGGVERGDNSKGLRYFGGLSLVSILACLTKQLVALSLPGVAALWSVLFFKLLRTPSKRATLVVLAITALVAWGLDRLFPTPMGYFGSGLLYVLSTGSSHGSEITVNGSNLFSLLPVASNNSSTDSHHLFSLLGHDIRGVPHTIGIVSAIMLLLLGAGLTARLALLSRPLSSRTTTLLLLGFTAFCNLSLYVVLTGVHERYLFHYGFFALPVLLALVARNRAYLLLLSLVVAQLVVYGFFVLLLIDGSISQRAAHYAYISSVFGNLVVLGISIALALFAARGSSARRKR